MLNLESIDKYPASISLDAQQKFFFTQEISSRCPNEKQGNTLIDTRTPTREQREN